MQGSCSIYNLCSLSISAVVGMAILVLCVVRTSLSGCSFCGHFFIMSRVEFHLVGMCCISDSFFCSCSICFCSNSAALAGLCLKWPTTFSTFGQDIVKHTVVQTYCDRMLETVCDAGDVFKRQMFCSSNHISCTVLSVLTLFETFHCAT